MPKYKIQVTEVVTYEVEICSPTKSDAESRALRMITEAEDRDDYFHGLDDRRVTLIEEVRAKATATT